jgi:FAD/FMN-containing dehydrogenase
MDLIGPMPYTQFQALLDPGNPPGLRNYVRGEYLTAASDEAIDTFVERAREPLTPFNQIIVFRLGQVPKAFGAEDSAFSHRADDYIFHPITMWEDPADDERLIGWAREFAEAMRPFETGGVYLNFMTDADRVRDAFGEGKYKRLVALKDRYDPENLFRHNQNVEPSKQVGEPLSAV